MKQWLQMSLSLVQVLDLNFSALIYGPCTPCLGQGSKVKGQRGKKTLLTLGSLWASMLPSISLHSASNLCTCKKKKKFWNHGKVCYCQFQLNDHLKLFLSITHFLWHLIFIYKLFNNSDNKIGVRILGCYHKKEFLY